MKRNTAISTIAIAVFAGALVLAPRSVQAQGDPGRPLILAAADRLNAITPPQQPQQVIDIGGFDGTTNKFLFTLPDTYPPNLPEYKKAENGGYVQPDHFADITSYNVKYVFGIRNKPPNFSLTLTVPEPGGQTSEKLATVNAAGTQATVTFNPTMAGRQIVKIQRSGGTTNATVTARIAPQVGSFVVPSLLVSIIYEPPGARSSASYTRESTAGTVESWGFARTGGTVKVINQDEFRDDALRLAEMAAKYAFNDTVGAVVSGIHELLGHTEVETTESRTHAENNSHGTYFSVADQFTTTVHQYPGHGDAFIVLKDVLFVYYNYNGIVKLFPAAYSRPSRALIASELPSAVLAAQAQRFTALDPMLSGQGPRNAKYLDTLACERSVVTTRTYTATDVNSHTVSETNSQTEVEKNTGVLAKLTGGSTTFPLTYSTTTSKEQVNMDKQVATVNLQAGESETPFDVDIYYDQIFGTLIATRGQPLAPQPRLAGTISDESGAPVARQRLALTLGGKTYSVFSDAKGDFRFPFQGMAQGSATLAVGKYSQPVTLTSTPQTQLKLTVRRALLPATRR